MIKNSMPRQGVMLFWIGGNNYLSFTTISMK